MAIIDVLIPAYRASNDAFRRSLGDAIRRAQCFCNNHDPWECDNGKHSVFTHQIGSCVIHWTRNSLVSLGLHAPTIPGRPRADYFLLLDDDILMEAGTIDRLLSHGKDLVVGICTKRRDPPEPTIRRWNKEQGAYVGIIDWDWNTQKLIEVDGAGAACMLVKRGVLEAMAEAYLKCTFEKIQVQEALIRWNAPLSVIDEFKKDLEAKSAKRFERYAKAMENQDWDAATCWWFDFMKDPGGGELGELGEDMAFCWRAKQLGFKIWADPQVRPGHLGDYAYSVHDYIWCRESQKASKLPREKEEEIPAVMA